MSDALEGAAGVPQGAGNRYWIVVRQDDNGVKYLVSEHAIKVLAEQVLRKLESHQFKPHKMTYWIEEREYPNIYID